MSTFNVKSQVSALESRLHAARGFDDDEVEVVGGGEFYTPQTLQRLPFIAVRVDGDSEKRVYFLPRATFKLGGKSSNHRFHEVSTTKIGNKRDVKTRTRHILWLGEETFAYFQTNVQGRDVSSFVFGDGACIAATWHHPCVCVDDESRAMLQEIVRNTEYTWSIQNGELVETREPTAEQAAALAAETEKNMLNRRLMDCWVGACLADTDDDDEDDDDDDDDVDDDEDDEDNDEEDEDYDEDDEDYDEEDDAALF